MPELEAALARKGLRAGIDLSGPLEEDLRDVDDPGALLRPEHDDVRGRSTAGAGTLIEGSAQMTRDQADILAQAFRNGFEAQVDVETVHDRGRYRFAVVSPRFRGMTHLERQDALWQLADKTLPRDVTIDVSLILAFAPEELAAAGS
jgi:stress-induced morphogen